MKKKATKGNDQPKGASPGSRSRPTEGRVDEGTGAMKKKATKGKNQPQGASPGFQVPIPKELLQQKLREWTRDPKEHS